MNGQIQARLARLASLTSFTLAERRRYDWQSIEADLGIPLPIEYKEYVSYFPSGMFGGIGEIGIMHPAERGGFTGLSDQIRLSAEMFGGFSRLYSADPRYRFYPEPGGLVPWADYESTAALCWLTGSDDPDQWPVIACNDINDYESVEGSTIEALIRVLRMEAGRAVFPETMYARYPAGADLLKFTAGEPPIVELGPADGYWPD